MIHKLQIHIVMTTCIMLLMFTSNVFSQDKLLSDIDLSSVDAAVESIQNQLEDDGYDVVLVIDHSDNVAGAGLELRPTQVILARYPSRVETRLLERSDTIGIDLPVKVLVYEDESGEVQLSINSNGYLIDRHSPENLDDVWQEDIPFTDTLVEVDTGLIHVESTQSIDDTVSSIVTALGSNPNIFISLILEYSSNHRKKDGPQLIIFGNPNLGGPLMQADQRIGLDLPQKMLVWENDSGEVIITYNDPFFIGDRHDLEGEEQIATYNTFATALANFASIGSGTN